MLFAALLCSFPIAAQTKVYVAAYDYPPYFSDILETDLTRELIKCLNAHQNNYEFVIEVIPPSARYEALSEGGCCDVVFFESPVWGWEERGIPVDSTFPLVRGKERLVTAQKEGRSQAFFNNFKGKSLAGVKGYHYLIAGELRSSNELKNNYAVYLADSRITNIRMVLGGRIDLTTVNDELLAALEGSTQINIEDLLLAEKPDFVYDLHLLVGNSKKIQASTLQRFLSELGRKGEIDRLFRRFNMERFQLYRPSTIR
ncbi:amino acid ABC transporter substrate-binding protein [Idiomarina piscisalsi]|uniref:Amino acid ABC transporter substrate-binding protein n=1 Tax=Idiomarina piscisalsi TaxID=1096243 RepID=A0A432YUF1_9GAMM|nr:amino acid ABC transporter substrate-binding protein [Idiomarina piscisalsi]